MTDKTHPLYDRYVQTVRVKKDEFNVFRRVYVCNNQEVEVHYVNKHDGEKTERYQIIEVFHNGPDYYIVKLGYKESEFRLFFDDVIRTEKRRRFRFRHSTVFPVPHGVVQTTPVIYNVVPFRIRGADARVWL